MTTLPTDPITSLDADFAPMALQVGESMLAVPGLSIREKMFTWITSDVCDGNLGLPFETHLKVLTTAGGASWQTVREVLRHLAPYAGYPAVVRAFVRLAEIEAAHPEVKGVDLPAPEAWEPPAYPEGADAGLAAFATDQAGRRWGRPYLTPRERALICVAADVVQQTLGTPFRTHVEAARRAGVEGEELRWLLRMMAELSVGRSIEAMERLDAYLKGGTS
ncbi:carboxymuconolactone decarboxylase family protein [Nonomuraea sp. B10E15]|uniref:carboxymuconolactone decarboxylase family protein n=1 Tax=Nonomuraea sp. B10E15 TaxID=3153560 RepID=UPI00325F8B1D